MRIRPADPGEAAELSHLGEASKRHWGYDEEFIAATRHDIAVSADQIADHCCFVAERDGDAVGFYLLADGYLERMFVRPAEIGTGVGRALMDHMREQAAARKLKLVTIIADPNAAGFYRRMGAIDAGLYPSKEIPGRQLPILELAIG